LRIMLINNGGGGIFKQLPGLENTDIVSKYVSASHDMKAKGFVEATGIRYVQASDVAELDDALPILCSSEGDSAALLEVFTQEDLNREASKTHERLLREWKK
ncbi:MAG: 2-succinyl-5-enolpyruvyl-6-hydroxy-3-cyclohexene-1-carboxylic-acid synthase, partial [Bacteroidia bacterium]|nr:2-succinyl-5-enolpyruvyl-6-hydroxy-3-cyclohexene-1-carboxylic-acid synthase [Bacteroidia bacterium]